MDTPQLDTHIRPQDDYYGYVNNVWLAANPIPPSESSWGAFNILRDAATESVHTILRDIVATQDDSLTHDQQLLKLFYTSAMNFESCHENHYEYLRELAASIDAIKDSSDLARTIGLFHRRDQSPFFTLYVDHDDKDSHMQVMRIHQSGLTLPNRDYYLDTSKRMQDVRRKYRDYYTLMGQHLPDILTGSFETILNIETSLARAAWTNVALRDIAKNYNPYTLTSLRQTFVFDWDAYFFALGWQQPNDHIVVSQPTYLTAICKVLATLPLEDIKQYLRWQLLDGWYSWIDTASADLTFDFFGRTINGTTEQKPLWKRATQYADNLIIGEAIGREYAARHFPESSRQAVLEIVEVIRSAYHERIDQLTWMGDATKKRAHTKLNAIAVLIGYPNVWKDLSGLDFLPNNHLKNIVAARAFRTDQELAKIGHPPAAEQWEMHAHTVNAYHHPNRLEIVFPAAILQPPFYDSSASIATNLGGIGAVIGHEFTHGFDDQGADFDEQGNTYRWQTPDERRTFDQLANNIVRIADSFETVPGICLQGKLILGEAIADIGGLQLAVSACQRMKPGKTSSSDMKDLFLNFARCECSNTTTERLIQLAKIDPHPPSVFRVNCVVNHIDAFYDCYGVEATDNLYLPPARRAKIW